MPRLTNSSTKYYDEIVRLLSNSFDDEWEPKWNYCEMTQLLVKGYSYTYLIKDKNNKFEKILLYRSWEYGNKSMTNRQLIFNLDDIDVKENIIHISLNEIFEIQELLKKDIKKIEQKHIKLDGYFKKLTNFKTQESIIWNLDQEMNENLKELIFKIRNLK